MKLAKENVGVRPGTIWHRLQLKVMVPLPGQRWVPGLDRRLVTKPACQPHDRFRQSTMNMRERQQPNSNCNAVDAVSRTLVSGSGPEHVRIWCNNCLSEHQRRLRRKRQSSKRRLHSTSIFSTYLNSVFERTHDRNYSSHVVILGGECILQ